MTSIFRTFVLTVLSLALIAVASPASANVKKEGVWPSDEHRISLDFEGNTLDGVKKLSSEAGWSLVLPSTTTLESTKVAIHVKDQSPSDVLDALLAEGDYLAVRTGTLVRVATVASNLVAPVTPLSPAVAPSSAPMATPAVPMTRGEDRMVTGSHLTIEKNEVVHDVAVLGGSVDVFGTVTGDLVAVGGKAIVHAGARIVGDATAVGGGLVIEPGANIAGHSGVVGGVLENKATGGRSHAGISFGDSKHEADSDEKHTVKESGSAFSRASMLFVFGALFLALAGRRMETLKLEAIQRPARSFAMGIVGIIGFAVTLIALCVTIVGIPIAILVAIFGSVAAFAGIVAVLTLIGAALAKHKTDNVYAHLAVGCALFFLSGLLPFVGSWITVLVTFIGIGVTVATRFGGLLPATKRA